MLSIILSVFHKCRPVRIQATLVISYYSHVVIEGTAPGVGWRKELLLLVEDGVHPNPIARGLAQMAHNTLHISLQSDIAKLIQKTSLIWDEIMMSHVHLVDCGSFPVGYHEN